MPSILETKLKKILKDENTKLVKSFIAHSDKHLVRSYFLAPKNPKATVVFVHATGNDCLFPQLLLFKALTSQGYNVFTFDLDGHGSESTTLLEDRGIWLCVDRAVRSLKSQYGTSQFHLIGQSLGAALSLNFAASHPDDIKTLTLVSLPTKINISVKTVFSELTSLGRASFYRHVNAYGLAQGFPAFGAFQRKRFPVRLKREQKNSGSIGCQNNYLEIVKEIFSSKDLTTLIKKVEAPTLLCYGGSDYISTTEDARKYKENSRHPTYLEVAETHFTTLLSKKVESAILEHLNQYEFNLSS